MLASLIVGADDLGHSDLAATALVDMAEQTQYGVGLAVNEVATNCIGERHRPKSLLPAPFDGEPPLLVRQAVRRV